MDTDILVNSRVSDTSDGINDLVIHSHQPVNEQYHLLKTQMHSCIIDQESSYYDTDRYILINQLPSGWFRFSEEFMQILYDNSLICDVGYHSEIYDLSMRTNDSIIQHAIDFGLRKASGFHTKLSVLIIPAFHHFSLFKTHDGIEFIKLTFPWKQLAELLHKREHNHPLVKYVK